MREILFRGKRKLGNEWIEGSLHTEKFADDEEYLCCEINQCDVYPETVGQYTGLTDKNGKKIFEGDIVKHYNHNPIKEYSEDIGRVFWFNPTQRYLKTSSLFPDEFHELFEEINCYEVIGNIHDNPELLDG